jgi:hypothetical protein
LAEGASAAVPTPLVVSTVRAAALVAAGQAAAVSTPAAVLMKGVLQAMFLAKLKIVVTTAMVVLALGAGGVVYHVAAGPSAAQAAAESKPPADAEALRRENELLKLNLQLTLEKILAQEAELRTLRARAEAARDREKDLVALATQQALRRVHLDVTGQEIEVRKLENIHSLLGAFNRVDVAPDAMQEVEAALKSLREARDKEAKQKAADVLEKALKKLREQLK